MTKRKVSGFVLACLFAVMVILMAVPIGASAASGIQGTPQWSGAVFTGTDTFYNTEVVAFEAGSTAKLTALVKNEGTADATIREAKIKFDWGGVFDATNAPTLLKAGETAVFVFEFTVPDVSVATNTTTHSYEVIVGYQNQGTGYVKSFSAGEDLGVGDGATQDFYVNATHIPVLPASVKVYYRDIGVTPNTITLRDTSSYLLNPWEGKITFGTAPTANQQVYVDYQYFENVGSGNGVNTVFYTGSAPVAAGALVYLGNTVTQEFAAVTPSAVDLETGKITLASAPTSFQDVFVTYEYWSRWTATPATKFAVYSADQADAVAARTAYTNMNANYPNYLFTPGTTAAKHREEANVSAAKAAVEYKAGDFANAKTDYEAAVTSLQAAIDADATLNTGTEATLVGLLSDAGNVIDAYAAKLNAEAKEASGQASMYKNVGVFTILLGVATLLAGLAGILWAYSRLVAAKGPKQQTM